MPGKDKRIEKVKIHEYGKTWKMHILKLVLHVYTIKTNKKNMVIYVYTPIYVLHTRMHIEFIENTK